MIEKISRAFINELLSITNIVDVVGSLVKLKKSGKNFNACCPFHNEKHPSFIVNNEKQCYHCFSCGAHGNVVDFLMNYEQMNFVDAIEELARLNNLTIIYENHSTFNNVINIKRNALYNLMNNISIYYQKNLQKHESILAKKYLKHRGFNDDSINKFIIGFSPKDPQNLIKIFGESKENQNLLEKTGILINNNICKNYDRFQGRIIFPIRNIKGQVIAFGGRVINQKQPKYLNSSETDIFHKSKHLYGLYETKKTRVKIFSLLVVEGYIDVIILTQYGIDYSVALLGTSTTEEHIKLLYRNTDQIIFCYDGDHAGRQASWRTLNTALPYLTDDRQLNFMFLPNGEDPDSMIKKTGKKIFETLIKKAKPLSTILFETLTAQVNLKTPEGRVKLSKMACPLINKIPGETFKIYLKQKLSNTLGLTDENQVNKIFKYSIQKNKRLKKPIIKYTFLNILIATMVQNPQLAQNINITEIKKLKQIKQPNIKYFIHLAEFCKSKNKLTSAQILENYREHEFYPTLKTLSTWNHLITNDALQVNFIDTISKLYKDHLKKQQDDLITKDRTHGLTNKEKNELWSLNKELAQK